VLERLRRWRSADGGRIEALERRVSHLESLLEGLQDAVHRDAVRRDHEAARLERKTEPDELARALDRDARRRGL
jgi:uncharacterized coiled-coil protein SlyX